MSEANVRAAESPAQPPRGFLGKRGRFWSLVAGWFVPLIMTIAYFVLAITADTDLINTAWLGIALAFVLCIWWMIRTLTLTAALSRAFALGDADALLEIAESALQGRFVSKRAQLVLYKAAAYELRGQWSDALAAVDAAQLDADANPRLRVLAAAVSIGALVETGEVGRARTLYDDTLAPLARTLNQRLDAQLVIASQLAQGRLLAAEGHADARGILLKLSTDIRAGEVTRQRALALHRGE